jgi:hypothetical protein
MPMLEQLLLSQQQHQERQPLQQPERLELQPQELRLSVLPELSQLEQLPLEQQRPEPQVLSGLVRAAR